MFDHVGRRPGVYQGAAAVVTALVAVLLQFTNHRAAALVVFTGGGALLAVLTRIIDTRRNRTSEGWPLAQAVVESARATTARGPLLGWPSHVAVLDYAYRTADGYYPGVHYRSFLKAAQAHALGASD